MEFFNHKRHSIARPHGWAMGCVVKIFDKIDNVITALYCIYLYVCVRVCVLHISVLNLLHLHMFYNLTINIFYMKTEWLFMIYTEEFLIKQEENVLILVCYVSPCMYIYPISLEAAIKFVNITLCHCLLLCLSLCNMYIYIYHIEISHDCPTNVADKVNIYLGIVL